jgi:hypothetical protein
MPRGRSPRVCFWGMTGRARRRAPGPVAQELHGPASHDSRALTRASFSAWVARVAAGWHAPCSCIPLRQPCHGAGERWLLYASTGHR